MQSSIWSRQVEGGREQQTGNTDAAIAAFFIKRLREREQCCFIRLIFSTKT